MFRTITANPLLTVQGAYLVFAQEDLKDVKNGVTKKRYVILDSDTLQIRKTFEGENAKDNLGAELRLIEAEKAAKDPGSLSSLLASASTPVVPDPVNVSAATEEPVNVLTESDLS